MKYSISEKQKTEGIRIRSEVSDGRKRNEEQRTHKIPMRKREMKKKIENEKSVNVNRQKKNTNDHHKLFNVSTRLKYAHL